jgi:uncharacterized protein (TIGR04255 family)
LPKRYEHPPVVEAACEFRFDPASPWDLAMPGLMYEQLLDRFPQRESAVGVETTIGVGPEGVTTQQMSKQERLHLRSADGATTLQLAQNYLLLSRGAPYPGWVELKPSIVAAYETFVEVAKPTDFFRAGLRYINRFELPGATIELEDFFNFGLRIEDSSNLVMSDFLVIATFPQGGERDELRARLASVPHERPDVAVAIVLDLDYATAAPSTVGLDDVPYWLELAHGTIETVFESFVTEPLRKTFGSVTEVAG